MQDVDQSLADSFGLPRPAGALVAKVEADSPAAEAGIVPGDVILAADGKPVLSAVDLPRNLDLGEPGRTVPLQIWRSGRRVATVLKPTIAIDEPELAGNSTEHVSSRALDLLVRPLSAQEKQHAGVASGLFVEAPAGAAALAGVKPGDILLSVNEVPVLTVEDVRELLAQAKTTVALLVKREERWAFIPVHLF